MDPSSQSRSLSPLRSIHAHTLTTLTAPYPPTLPPSSVLSTAHTSLLTSLPQQGHGLAPTTNHLLDTIAPALNGASLSPSYYGFVIGGTTPAARAAAALGALYDQNVMVHLPHETVATAVEDKALRMLVELFKLDPAAWAGRTLTTGATGANVLGLACGREWIVSEKARRVQAQAGWETEEALRMATSVGYSGVLDACAAAGVRRLQVLTTQPHSCVGKAASVLGLGRAAVVDVGLTEGPRAGLGFDLRLLEGHLAERGAASVVVVSCGEVNTGGFATQSEDEMRELRALCDRYGAWLHVDGG